MAVGVVLAFAWNMTMSQPQGDTGTDSVTPQVGLAVEQAAAQAWASATPRIATARTVTAGTQAGGTQAGGTPAAGTSAASPPAAPDSGPWYARHAHGLARPAGDSCLRVWSPWAPDRTLRVRVVSACAAPLRVPLAAAHPVRRIREG